MSTPELDLKRGLRMSTRVLPSLRGVGSFFWTAGENNQLKVAWCRECSRFLHPSFEICPYCLGCEITPVAVSGEATLIAYTENAQQWLACHPPPYVIGIVALKEDAEIRLTTNIVGCDQEQLCVGLPLRVQFTQFDDVWLPIFAPATDLCRREVMEELPSRRVRARVSTEKFESKVALTGVGSSAIGRRLSQSSLALSIDACCSAIADAGLRREDIDGLCAYPGTDGLPGVSRGGVRAVEQILRIEPTWHCGAHEVPGQAGTLIEAMLAVAAGLCRHVLCFTTMSEAVRPAVNRSSAAGRVEGELAWQLPFGAASPANWIALSASHYMERFGMDRSDLGWIALSAHRHAQRNPEAIYQQALSMEDYLAARRISSPFGLYDCDVPCDAAIAVVVSRADLARDLRQPRVLVEAVGTQITDQQSWDQGTITHQPNVFGPAAHLWSRTTLCAPDVDVALLYDGFTFNVISWLEALRFCKIGEAAEFVRGGERIDLGGDLPINPHGGQLCAGRTNGYGHIREAIMQLRGQCGTRQVEGAKTAVVSSGGGIPASCMLLIND